MERPQLCLSVDFGTTFSGIAYMPLQGTVGQYMMAPTQLGSWPGQPPTRESYKVPTCVAYASDGRPPLWGFLADRPPHEDHVQWTRVTAFKTFLEPDITAEWESPIPGKTLHDVVRDFLNGMYQHLVYTLEMEGLSLNDVDYQILFTVPAPFSVHAVECFKRIIHQTGFGNHWFDVSLTEPEAAAIYTIATQAHMMRKQTPFQTQQCFLVCDAGGGTVDISSYAIAQLYPTIKVSQTGEVDGAVCGSTFIDRAFRNHIRSVLGAPVLRSLLPVERDMMLDQFVAQKERFNNTEASHIRLPRDDINCPGKKGGFLQITKEQMQEMFEGPVSQSCRLVHDHIQRCAAKGYSIDFVFLVGGFGTSPYLKQRLEETVRSLRPEPGRQIMVIKPADAQQSVVLGALQTQLQRVKKDEDPVISRLARHNYGFLSMRRFDPEVHEPHERYVHPITGEEMADNQIMWFIRKGDTITGSTVASIDRQLIRMFKTITSTWTETLVRYSGDNPPSRVAPGVETVCKMTSDLRECPNSEFVKKSRPNGKWCGMGRERYYEAMYTVRMLVSTADVKFEMWYRDMLRSELMSVSWEMLGDQVKS